MIQNAESIRALVNPDRVHKSVYTDEHIFGLEMKRIFESTWVYAGHDSQLKNPGDYLSVHIGRQPMIIVRDRGSNEIQAL